MVKIAGWAMIGVRDAPFVCVRALSGGYSSARRSVVQEGLQYFRAPVDRVRETPAQNRKSRGPYWGAAIPDPGNRKHTERFSLGLNRVCTRLRRACTSASIASAHRARPPRAGMANAPASDLKRPGDIGQIRFWDSISSMSARFSVARSSAASDRADNGNRCKCSAKDRSRALGSLFQHNMGVRAAHAKGAHARSPRHLAGFPIRSRCEFT